MKKSELMKNSREQTKFPSSLSCAFLQLYYTSLGAKFPFFLNTVILGFLCRVDRKFSYKRRSRISAVSVHRLVARETRDEIRARG
jgi:hypothetical protein